ncbi:MAG: ABC transporter permease [Phycisphaerae bacterium]|nr:ABC transporter permease [Phycisphaerae bacterium]
MFSGLAFETFRLGLKNLWLHRLRSLLTALGMMFGVAAVVCMLSITEAAGEKMLQLIQRLGTQNIIITSEEPDKGGQVSQAEQGMRRYGVNYNDLAMIRATVPHVARVIALREVAFEAVYGDQKTTCIVVGTEAGYFDAVHLELTDGRLITPYEHAHSREVCVIGDETRRRLFPTTDPIGQVLAVHAAFGVKPYKVVGALKRIETAGTPTKGAGGRDVNYDVYIPMSNADKVYGTMTVRQGGAQFEAKEVPFSDVYVEVDSLDHVKSVSEMVIRIMEHNHGDKEDFRVHVPLEQLRVAQEEKRDRQILMGMIAFVSLLVGGIGIMNIMLATVTDRTREIGVRRALGAKQRHIAVQFLVETVVLAMGGGLLGLVVGWGGSRLIPAIFEWPTVLQPWTMAASFGLSVLIGVFFGMYPAMSAAKLDPIEALRYE